jgi:hypothetical protein
MLVVRWRQDDGRLLASDGHPVAEFLLHSDGDDAWWRWSDTPFVETEAEP